MVCLLTSHAVLATNLVFSGSLTSSFRTDTEISSRGPAMLRERELQRWDAGEGESLEDMALDSGGAGHWDQFATNERMYGVQSTYDENIYTTAIDRSNPQYKQREAQAARIAREIEGSSAADAHIAEERRRDADRGDGLDEEEKYSGVRREVILPKRAAGAYIPPSQRPITSTPTVRGAPFDPAIISTTKPAGDKAVDTAASGEQAAVPQANTPTITEPALPASEVAAPTAGPSQPVKKSTETTAEDHIRNTTDAFKQFANNEKLKIRQTQESKRMAMRQEKAVKLNDLKKFAANFKLKSRVPDDLVPILAKDHEKQLEIQKRADDAAKEEEVRANERAKQKASPQAADIASPSSSKEPELSIPDRGAGPISHRARVSQNLRGSMMGGPPSGRGIANGRGGPPYGRQPIQPLPENLRMPAAPSGPTMPMSQDAGPMSPGAAKRLNVNAKAFEFRPGANAFTPTGASPSPQRTGSGSSKAVASKSYFSKKKSKTSRKTSPGEMDAQEWPSKTTEFTEDQKKPWGANGGQPQPYRAPPTWGKAEKNINATIKDFMPSKQSQVPSHGPSPMHTPGPNMAGQMPHAHQLPPHLQQGPPVAVPSQRPQYMVPHQQGPHPGQFDPRMAGQPMYGPNGSVQNSPRFPQAQMAYGPQMGMPQFGGQGGVPGKRSPDSSVLTHALLTSISGYGMSPSMQYRQPNMQPQNGGMVMQPGMQPNNYPPMPSGPFPNPPNFNNQQMQGRPPFMNGPHQGGAYSPMPPHAQPQHMGPPQGPYNASPRPGPHMMQHTNSHQGFQGGGMMQPPFAPSPGHHPMHMGQRQYSHGAGPPQYGMPQMTPRQGQAMPHQHGMSPMGGMQQGEDGK